jgi:hypothetical protein
MAVLNTAIAVPVLACTPDPNTAYDDVQSRDIAIGIAEVTSMVVSPFAVDGSCRTLQYVTTRSMMGNVPEEFTVETCDDYLPVDEWGDGGIDPALMHDMLGYEVGAEVILGLVFEPEGPTPIRYAVPSCWGPLHLRLDTMTEPERAAFVQEVLDALSGAIID